MTAGARGSKSGSARRSRERRLRFGSTWWGAAWLDALQKRALLDPSRLPRGRTYARGGAVVRMNLDRGRVRALVRGTRSVPYEVLVRVRVFKPEEWAIVLEVIASSAANAAALLDGDLRPALAGELRSRGVDPLPRAGEVVPACTCPDWANPCKHAAAVCYLVANLLDEDPFNLLLLRGRARGDVLAQVRRLRSDAAAPALSQGRTERPPERPVAAGRLGRRELLPVPLAPPPPERPGRPVMVGPDPPAGSPVSRQDLAELAADASRRAWELATGQGDGGLGLSVDADLARRAERWLGAPEFADRAARAGRGARAVARLALAWRAAGAGGVEVLLRAWDPSAGDLREGEEAMVERGLSPRRWRNRVSAPGQDRQLRLGRDGLWYLLVRTGAAWELHRPPEANPGRLLETWEPSPEGGPGGKPAPAELGQGGASSRPPHP